jgi:hypothetical protein
LFAENDLIGTSGFSFLKVNFSARINAMGGAYTALSNNSDAVFSNPAGLNEILNREFNASYMNYFDGIQTGAISFATQKNNIIHYGGFIKYMSGSETRTLTDQNGDFLGEDGTFGFSNTVFGFSGSYYINSMLSVGANAKILFDILDDNSSSAIAFDFGLLHQSTNENLKIGLTMRNVGKQLTKYTKTSGKEDLPKIFTLGFSYHPKEELYVNFDIRKPTEGDYSGLIGAEYQIHPLLALRTGYKTNASDWKAGGDAELFSGISFGIGLNWQKYLVDYAVASYGDLGLLNTISLSYKF